MITFKCALSQEVINFRALIEYFAFSYSYNLVLLPIISWQRRWSPASCAADCLL